MERFIIRKRQEENIRNRTVEIRNLNLEDRGKMKAIDVTGPKGEFVQGAPRNNRNY